MPSVLHILTLYDIIKYYTIYATEIQIIYSHVLYYKNTSVLIILGQFGCREK